VTTSLESWYACTGYEGVAKTGMPLPWKTAEAFGRAFRVLFERNRGNSMIEDRPQARSLTLLSIEALSSDILTICFYSFAILPSLSLAECSHSCNSIHFAC
jgi:hypothetical protein